jgi:F-type H+-transporting ATPase subunit b
MLTARSEADEIIQTAKTNASKRAEKIVTEASERAEEIVRQAELDASLELERAQQDIKYQIVNVSAALAEKMLAREINTSDHRELIDSVIDNIGENDGADV